MRFGAIRPCLALEHVGLRHVQAALMTSQHGTGLQRGLAVGGLWPRFGRVFGLFFLLFLEGAQTIFAPQPNAKQHSQ